MYKFTSHRLLSITIQRIFLSVIFCSFIYATKAQPLPFFGATSNNAFIEKEHVQNWGKESSFSFGKKIEISYSKSGFQDLQLSYPTFQMNAAHSNLNFTKTKKIYCFKDFVASVFEDSIFLLLIPVAITAFYFLRKKV